MAGIFEVRSIETGVYWVGGRVLMMDFCWMIFDLGGLGGFGGVQMPLGPYLTSQFLLEQQSLIHAFMLDKFLAQMSFALTWLSLCLQFEKQYFLRNHLGQAWHLLFNLGLLSMFLITHILLGSMQCSGWGVLFLIFLLFVFSIIISSSMAAVFLSAGCCGCLGCFHCESWGRVIWNEPNRTWEMSWEKLWSSCWRCCSLLQSCTAWAESSSANQLWRGIWMGIHRQGIILLWSLICSGRSWFGASRDTVIWRWVCQG